MTTQNSRFFDEIGRMMNGAAGAADGLRREVPVCAAEAKRIGGHKEQHQAGMGRRRPCLPPK